MESNIDIDDLLAEINNATETKTKVFTYYNIRLVKRKRIIQLIQLK